MSWLILIFMVLVISVISNGTSSSFPESSRSAPPALNKAGRRELMETIRGGSRKNQMEGAKEIRAGHKFIPPPPSPLLKPNEKFRTKDGWSMVLALRRDALNYSAYLRKQLENLSQRLLSCFLRRWLLSVAILKNYPERTLGTRLTNVTKRDGR